MAHIIFGRNTIAEFLDGGWPIVEVLLTPEAKGQGIEKIEARAQVLGIPLRYLSRQELTREAHSPDHQGVAAVVARELYFSVEELLSRARQKNEAPLLALLDGIEDPHNLGAIIRSAEAAGLHGIILPERRAVNLTPTVAKASAGAVAHVPIAKVTNLARTVEELKAKGLWFAGADQNGEQVYTQANLTGALGIVIGGEGQGLRRLVREKCDFLLRIPMRGHINSLNASVAAALLFFEARRQREAKAEEGNSRPA